MSLARGEYLCCLSRSFPSMQPTITWCVAPTSVPDRPWDATQGREHNIRASYAQLYYRTAQSRQSSEYLLMGNAIPATVLHACNNRGGVKAMPTF
eukprot:114037-Heterocapsa_arctica.AAC.1